MVWSADGVEFGLGQTVYTKDGASYVVDEIAFGSNMNNEPEGFYAVDEDGNYEFLFGSEVYANAPHEAHRRVAHEVIDQDEDEFYCPTCDEVTMTSMEVVGRPACGQCQTTYPCPECGAPELDEPDHDSDKPFMCDACGAVFDESNLGATGSRKIAERRRGEVAATSHRGETIWVSESNGQSNQYRADTQPTSSSDIGNAIAWIDDALSSDSRMSKRRQAAVALSWNWMQTADGVWVLSAVGDQASSLNGSIHYNDNARNYEWTCSKAGPGEKWHAADPVNGISRSLDDAKHEVETRLGLYQPYYSRRRQAGSMEQDMGNMGDSYDGGSASGGGSSGGYIYDVSDYETYAHTYNTVTDVPSEADDSAVNYTANRNPGYFEGRQDALAGLPPVFTLRNLASLQQGTPEYEFINGYVSCYNSYAKS